jgi:putative inorganic carbon (hco3(-)) transporter
VERLTFGYGVGTRHVEPQEAQPRTAAVREEDVRPVVADPLPGESSDWAYFGLLSFTAVLFLRPQDQLPILEPLHLAELSALVGLAAMAVKRLARQLPILQFSPEISGLAAFGLVLVGTTPFSFWPGGSIEVITDLYIKVLLIVVLMVNSLNTPVRLQRFTVLVVAASAYLGLRAVIDYVRGVNMVEGDRVAGAVMGVFGNPNDLALNMVAFLPFAALLALAAARITPARRGGRERAPARLVRATAAGAVLLMLLTIVFTKSRGGALGLVAMVAVLLYYGRRVKPGLVAAFVLMAAIMLPLLPGSFWNRMDSITDPGQDATGSRAARRQVMLEAADVFMERPLTGIGAGQFKNYNPPGRQERWREAHDVWLQVASETGIFGLLAFSFLVVSAFRGALSSRRRLASRGDPESIDLGILQLHATALVPSLVGWFVCAIFASVAYNWTFYYLLGLAAVTRQLTERAVADRSAEAPAGRPGRTGRPGSPTRPRAAGIRRRQPVATPLAGR